MSDTEFIAKQAIKIDELESSLFDLQDRIKKAKLHMVCIGGPLNDNKLQFNKEQRKVFHSILQELED